MAQKVILIDDLDGSEGNETLTYTVDGQEYEIDLSEKNAKKFRAQLEVYIEKSRPVERQLLVTSGRTTRRRGTTGRSRDDLPQIRAWAEAEGLSVSPRGRIKQEILDQYDAAHTKA